MSYIPTRDSFDLSTRDESRLYGLAETIDDQAVVAYHSDECGCRAGEAAIADCTTGAACYSPSVVEVLAHLHTLGVLDLAAAEKSLKATT